MMWKVLAAAGPHVAAAAIAGLTAAELVYPAGSAWMKVGVAVLAGLGIYAPRSGK